MNIGKALREIRIEKKLTQVDVEKRSGLTRYYISRIESGTQDPTLANLKKFASALREPLYALIYRIEKTKSLPTPRNRKPERYTNLILMVLPKLRPFEREALLAFSSALARKRCKNKREDMKPGAPLA